MVRGQYGDAEIDQALFIEVLQGCFISLLDSHASRAASFLTDAQFMLSKLFVLCVSCKPFLGVACMACRMWSILISVVLLFPSIQDSR